VSNTANTNTLSNIVKQFTVLDTATNAQTSKTGAKTQVRLCDDCATHGLETVLCANY
jgi:hypothetical protein